MQHRRIYHFFLMLHFLQIFVRNIIESVCVFTDSELFVILSLITVAVDIRCLEFDNLRKTTKQ